MKNAFISILILVFVVLGGVYLFGNKYINVEEKTTGEKLSMDIYKTPSCGCCDIYSKYMSNKGVAVNEINLDHLEDIKGEYSIPHELMACHTSVIDGYAVEGHIPLDAIEKLLSEKPDIKGIALAGMPSGTPGMPGPKMEEWVIYYINTDGSTSEFLRM